MHRSPALLATLAAATTLALAAAAPASAADKIGDCELYGKKGTASITPAKPGQLTVETNLPAPGWWNGTRRSRSRTATSTAWPPTSPTGPASTRSQVENVSFDQLVAGQTNDFDLALAQISITDGAQEGRGLLRALLRLQHRRHGEEGLQSRREVEQVLDAHRRTQATTAADFIPGRSSPRRRRSRSIPDTPSMFTALPGGPGRRGLPDTAIVLGEARQPTACSRSSASTRPARSTAPSTPRARPTRRRSTRASRS